MDTIEENESTPVDTKILNTTHKSNKKRTNKKKGTNKEKKEIQYRTKEERRDQVREILKKLSEFQLNIKYEPISKLYRFFKEYIDEGRRIEVNIPFPDINRRIKGLLAISIREETWINLQHEKFK